MLKKREIRLIGLFCLIFFKPLSIEIFGQNLEFTNYTTKDGLISNEVYNLFQDQDGYIWIFFKYGTAKYNGSNFKPILKNLPIQESFMFSVFQDNSRKIYLANSKAKLYKVRNDSAIRILGTESISEPLLKSVSEISKLIVDHQSNIYVLTKSRCFALYWTKNGFKTEEIDSIIDSKRIQYRIVNINNESILIRDRFKGNEFYFKKNENRSDYELHYGDSVYKFPYKVHSYINKLKKYDKDIYFSFGNKLGRIDSKGVLTFIDVNAVIINYVMDKEQTIWIATLNNGLIRINKEGLVLEQYLKDLTVNDVMIDKNGSLWASTATNGVFYCKDISGVSSDLPKKLGNGVCFIKKAGKNLYIAKSNGEIFELGENGSVNKIRSSDRFEPVNIVCAKSFLYFIMVGKIEVREAVFPYKLIAILSDLEKQYDASVYSGDTIICMWRRGITLVNKNKQIRQYDFGRKITTFLSLDQSFYCGTENGVVLYEIEKLANNLVPNSLPIPDTTHFVSKEVFPEARNAVITKIVRDAKKRFWVCTQGSGLFMYGENRSRHFVSDSALIPSDFIFDIEFDGDSTILLSTNKGIYSAEYKGIDAKYVHWNLLEMNDVAQSEVWNNLLFFIKQNSLCVKDLGAIRTSKSQLFKLLYVKIDDKIVEISGINNVINSNSKIELNFELINFTNPNLDIKYKLKGFYRDSGYISGRKLVFNHLPAGEYRLEVEPNSKEDKSLAMGISFIVRPRFYESKTFIFFTAILIISLFMGLYFLLTRYIKRKESRGKETQKILNEYKLMALKAQINPHFMSNCLTAIQYLIQNKKIEIASYYISRFGLLVRRILDSSSLSLISLEEELELSSLYVELEQLRFEHKFNYTVELDKTIRVSNVYVPPLILNPIIENAIKHGLLPAQYLHKCYLFIKVYKKGQYLVISIEDNGLGRNQDKQEEKSKKSYGLILSEQRIQNLNSHNSEAVLARLELEDLVKTNTQKGTKVTIYLPNNLTPDKNGKDKNSDYRR